MFRGKKSSNRIELSRLVQDLLNFGVSGSLQLWGVGWVTGGWGGAGWGVPSNTCAFGFPRLWGVGHAHACMVNMIILCKWPPPLGESLGIPYDVKHTCVCMCMCMCVCMHVNVYGGTLSPPSTHIHPPPPPGGDPQNRSKFNSTWTNWDISIPFKDLKSVETSPPMGGWVGGLMGGVRSKH